MQGYHAKLNMLLRGRQLSVKLAGEVIKKHEERVNIKACISACEGKCFLLLIICPCHAGPSSGMGGGLLIWAVRPFFPG